VLVETLNHAQLVSQVTYNMSSSGNIESFVCRSSSHVSRVKVHRTIFWKKCAIDTLLFPDQFQNTLLVPVI